MSPFGQFHTAISLLPVVFGALAFVLDRKISPRKRLGQLYLVTMLAGTVSAFGFIPTKGFTPGQGLTLITLALLAVGTLTVRGRWRADDSVQAVALSASYLLLMVFTTTETLTRIPVEHPFAKGPTDPALLPIRLVLLVAFVLGVGFQILKLRSVNRATLTPQ